MPLDDRRAFVQLIPIVDSGEEDYLTKFRIHKYYLDNVLLVGLPAIQITGKHQYMVPVKLRDPSNVFSNWLRQPMIPSLILCFCMWTGTHNSPKRGGTSKKKWKNKRSSEATRSKSGWLSRRGKLGNKMGKW